MKTLAKLAGMAAICLGLGACAQKPVPEDNFYRLTLKGPETPIGAALPNGVILVERFAADGLTGGRPIVFSETGRADIAQTYHYDFWIEPPTILLQMALADTLRQAGVKQVVTPELRVEPDVVIAGRIRAFEQVRGTPGLVRVQLDLAVTDRASGKLLMFKAYSAEPATTGDGVAQAVLQLGRAVDQIYSQFLKDLAAR